MDTCVRNGNFDEALDLESCVSKLVTQQPGLPPLPPPSVSFLYCSPCTRPLKSLRATHPSARYLPNLPPKAPLLP